MAENSELTVKVNLDCEEVIKGLKAIQREAKEATKSLRELEDSVNDDKQTEVTS